MLWSYGYRADSGQGKANVYHVILLIKEQIVIESYGHSVDCLQARDGCKYMLFLVKIFAIRPCFCGGGRINQSNVQLFVC